MKLSKSTIQELGVILKEEFSLELNDKQLSKLAYVLVGFFSLIAKIETRHKFGNSSSQAIASNRKQRLDNK